MFYFKALLLIPLGYLLLCELGNFFRFDGYNSSVGFTALKITIIASFMLLVYFHTLLNNLKNHIFEVIEKKVHVDMNVLMNKNLDSAPPCKEFSMKKPVFSKKQVSPNKVIQGLKGKVQSFFTLSTKPRHSRILENEHHHHYFKD